MELKQFLSIFIKYRKSFFGIILFFLLGGITYFYWQPENYKVSLLLNISRGSQISAQNEENGVYNDFYRLQADERFADTVVRWLGSPWVVKSVLTSAEMETTNLKDKQLRGFFSAKRMSSQVVDVTFITKNNSQAEKLSSSIKKIINQETEKLNEKQNQKGWFVVLGDEPVVTSNQKGWLFLVVLSGMIGLFISFGVVMFRHYWNEEKNFEL
jgi:uncharacterized protein involved in exopolysaccharide biosynthesis